MPGDAKLGLLVGVGLVILSTVVFFQKEPRGNPAGEPAAAVSTPETNTSKVSRASIKATPLQVTPAVRSSNREITSPPAAVPENLPQQADPLFVENSIP